MLKTRPPLALMISSLACMNSEVHLVVTQDENQPGNFEDEVSN
jgi:hypothetical protein